MIIHTPLSITLVATATAATMVFIALAHMPRPSRATALWVAMFANLMFASYIWTGSDVLESVPLKAIANGLILGSMTLLWSGMRSYRGVPSRLAIALAAFAAFPIGLLLISFTSWYGIGFRAAFVCTAVFAALTIAEALRLGRSVRNEVLPLIAVCSLFIVFSCVTILDGMLVAAGSTQVSDSLLFVRGVNFIGSNVFVLCTLITLMQLTTRDDTVRSNSPVDMFERVVRDRLERAEAVEDTWWSFVDIRLDDPTDIRIASSTAMFKEICDRFAREVVAVLPADADLQRRSPTQIVAFVPRAHGGMREILSDVLRGVASIEPPETFPIRLSASIGWVHAATADYNFDVLLSTAEEAVQNARDLGGDRWERVHEEN